jgi:hypothetical protein
MSSPHSSGLPPELQKKRKLTLPQVAELTSLSEDTIRRRYSHLIDKLSPRRDGMSVENALSIGSLPEDAT